MDSVWPGTSFIKVESEEEISIIDVPDIDCEVSITVEDDKNIHEERDIAMPCLNNSIPIEKKKKNLKDFICSFCNTIFRSKQMYTKHLKKHKNTITMYACAICNTVFDTKNSLNGHMRSKKHLTKASGASKPVVIEENLPSKNRPPMYRGPKRIFKCTMCGKVFYVEKSLIRHMNAHLGIKPETCSVCGKRYASKHCLMEHNERVHMKLKPYTCDICGKAFAWRSGLSNHKLLHTDFKAYFCDKCGKRFRRKSHLELHSRTHSMSKDYLCMFCGKLLKDKQQLDIHEGLHQGYVHECNLCNIKFRHRFRLVNHYQIHHQQEKSKGKTLNELSTYHKTRVETFCCSFCGKLCPTHKSLDSHERIHTKEKPYSCDICNNSFAKSSTLYTHMLVHKGDKDRRKYTCELCGKVLLSKQALKQHIYYHQGVRPFLCKICGKCFTQGAHLSTHLRIHKGLRPYVCSVCNKNFSTKGNLDQHKEVHVQTKKRFPCDHCNKTFLYTSRLKKHMKTHIVIDESPITEEVYSDETE